MSGKGRGSPPGRPPSKSPRSGRGGAKGGPPGRGGGRGGRVPAKGSTRGGTRSRNSPASSGSSVRAADRRSGRARPKTSSNGLGGEQVEGRHSVRELLLAGRRHVNEIWLASDLDPADIIDDIVELAREMRVHVVEVSRRKLEAESRTAASQGVIAFANRVPGVELAQLGRPGRDGTPPFLLAVDGVTDPGNLGALIRTAECAGVTGLVLPRHRAVHLTPTVTKAAAGAIEHVPMSLVGGLPAALNEMKDMGLWVVGLDAAGEQPLHELSLGAEGVCLVLGAEGAGLSRLVAKRCDVRVAIPLRGQLSSLNVATAGALACYEVVRCRS